MTTPRPLVVAVALFAAGCVASAEAPKPRTLTREEAAAGWVLAFDGETTFGWTIDGPAAVEGGDLVLGGDKATVATPAAQFGTYDAELETDGAGSFVFKEAGCTSAFAVSGRPLRVELKTRIDPKGGPMNSRETVVPGAVARRNLDIVTNGPATWGVEVPAGGRLRVKSARIKPVGAKSIFDGRTLDGWKVFAGEPKRAATKFTVTDAGELSAKNGPGDLQTVARYADFALQLECRTNGKALNSGVFFRCVPDLYQAGYEAQIHNGTVGTDRTKPLDFGTGAIYRRVPARKVVSDDNAWFALTLLARGPRLATWVNGYPTADWVDDREPNDNPRQGLRTAAGHLSIQGHDPTTDILFRNIRVTDLTPEK